MGRPLRLQFEGALYHVFTRGNRRARIAHVDRDYRILERYLIEAAHKTRAKPHAWYPMSNHLHTMVQTPLGNLAEFMQTWLSRYARYYNKAYAKAGHVFQGRYGCRLVDKDTYQKELLRYIHLQRYRAKNPEQVDASCDFYSSHRFYMGETCPPDVFNWIEPMLMLFGDTLAQAQKLYAQFLSEGLKSGRWEDFYKPKNGIIGSSAFIEKIEKQYLTTETRRIPEWQQAEFMRRLMQTATQLFQVQHTDLISVSQQRSLSRLRQAIAFIGRTAGIHVALIAQCLVRGSPTIIAMIDAAARNPSRELEVLRSHFNL
jgi:putative transposase